MHIGLCQRGEIFAREVKRGTIFRKLKQELLKKTEGSSVGVIYLSIQTVRDKTKVINLN